MVNRRFALFTRIILFFSLVGPVSLQAEPTTPAQAEKLYQDYCSVCHGDKGDGRSRARQGLVPPPKDFTDPKVSQSLTRDRMIDSVLNGRPGTAMAAWKTRLNQEQVEAIVDYVRNRFMTRTAAPGAARGAKIYAANCSVCHGDRGSGSVWASSTLNPPPRDFSKAVLPRAAMVAAITHGRPGSAMPGFASQLSAEEIALVVDYIRSAFMPAAEAGASPATKPDITVAQGADHLSQPMPNGLHGDPGAGKSFFDGNCATCHGTSGDGDGPRAYFIFPKPRNFLAPASRRILNRPALFQAIKHGVGGREMPAWGKVLTDQQIADVAEYVFQAFIAPANR